jgi:outer membrane protein OmpA-like peptidoglycan-associated protein
MVARQRARALQIAGDVQRVPPAAAPMSFAGNQAALRRLQAKLQVGAVNDPQEREADAFADRVMRMTAPAASAPPVAVHRKCAECESEGKLDRKAAVAGPDGGEAPASVHQTLAEPGRPLSETARTFFEPRFGRPLDHVRVHEGGQAAESAQAVGALAYASGRHVVLGTAAPAPESQAGRRLIAHELAHVVQQEHGSVRRACGPKNIGTPVGCETGDKTFVPGSVVHMVVNCDELTPAGKTELAAFVGKLPPTGTIQIDGYASVDGPEAYNFNLAAARALSAKRLLIAAGVPATRIGRLVDHGATPGKADDRRSVVFSVAAAAPEPAPAPKADPAPPKTQEKKADPKADLPAGTPTVEGKPKEDPPNVLEFQVPLSENVQVPVGPPGGAGVTPPPGQKSQALNQVNQPNIAAGANWTPSPKKAPRLSVGLFGQFGANFPIGVKPDYTLPQTKDKNPAYFTGLNTQIYLQPAFVIVKSGSWTVSGILQPGVGWTFKSPVPGEDGITYTLQGGLQASKDISDNWQFQGAFLVGGAYTQPNDPQPGQTPAWQPFVGAQITIQFHIPIVKTY